MATSRDTTVEENIKLLSTVANSLSRMSRPSTPDYTRKSKAFIMDQEAMKAPDYKNDFQQLKDQCVIIIRHQNDIHKSVKSYIKKQNETSRVQQCWMNFVMCVCIMTLIGFQISHFIVKTKNGFF